MPPADERFDVILDVTGILDLRRCRAALAPLGIFLPLEFGLREIGQSLACRLTSGARVVTAIARDRAADLDLVARLVEQAALRGAGPACRPSRTGLIDARASEGIYIRGSYTYIIAFGIYRLNSKDNCREALED